MISLFIKSYFAVLLPITIGSIFIFSLGLYFIFRSATKSKNGQTNVTLANADTETDLSAIAGEDVLSTQLDLARAYVETGKSQLAKKILEYVIKQGNTTQQDEARDLLGLI